MALPDLSLSPDPQPREAGGSASAFVVPLPVAADAAASQETLPVSHRDATAATPADASQPLVALVAAQVGLPGFGGAWLEASASFWRGMMELAAALGRLLMGGCWALLSPAAPHDDRHGPALSETRPRPRSALVRLCPPCA